MNALLLIAVLFAQAANGVVTGQLIAKDGTPAAGVRVSAMAARDSNASSAATTLVSFSLTDSAGWYRIESIPPGRYYIVAGPLDTLTYYPGALAINSASIVNVAAGATVENINFSPVGVSVSGRVVRPANLKVARELSVEMINSASGIRLRALPGADGLFQFKGVHPGTYTLFVSDVGTLGIPAVVVAEQNISGIEIVIPPPKVQVTGSIAVEGDGPRPRFSLQFVPFKGGTGNLSFSPPGTGKFSTPVPEGEYRMSWNNLPAGYFVKSIQSGTLDLLTNALIISASTPVAPLVVTLGVTAPPPWVRLSGRVKGIAPGSSTTYRIEISGTPITDTVDVTVQSDGTFEVPRILPGSYTAKIFPERPVPPFTIYVANKDVDNFEIVLPAMKEITGRVTVEGRPGPLRLGLTFLLAVNGNTNSVTAVTDPDGKFRITLPEGERQVSMAIPGFTVKSFSYGNNDLLRNSTAKISAADASEFNVVLTSGQTITVPSQPQPPPLTVQRIDGSLAERNLIESTAPVYPETARVARLAGSVVLTVTIAADGTVASVTVAGSSNAILIQAAVDAVKQWRYRPFLVNGLPSRVETTVTVNFTLP